MPLGAIINTVLGVGTSIYQGQQQANAAKEANKLAEQQAEAQFERAEKEWEIDIMTRTANWAWEYAQYEAQIYQEKQQKSDYEWRQGKLIDAAIDNLAVNQDALLDRYVSEENLRATQEGMALNNTMDKLTADSNEAARQYMTQIRQTGLQSQALMQQTSRESQELMQSLTLSMQKDYLERDMANIAAVIDDNATKARSVSRQGGSASSQRLAMNKAQELGRTFGMLKLADQDRDSRVALLNQAMQGERATQMGQYALAMEDAANKIKFTGNTFSRDGQYQLDVFNKLTIPGFELANKQGKRDLQSLYIQTQSTIDEASMPFRESIFFMPRQPIAGLKPEYFAPTKIYEPTGLDLAFNAISAGVQGAMQFSYQKPGGGLGFY